MARRKTSLPLPAGLLSWPDSPSRGTSSSWEPFIPTAAVGLPQILQYSQRQPHVFQQQSPSCKLLRYLRQLGSAPSSEFLGADNPNLALLVPSPSMAVASAVATAGLLHVPLTFVSPQHLLCYPFPVSNPTCGSACCSFCGLTGPTRIHHSSDASIEWPP